MTAPHPTPQEAQVLSDEEITELRFHLRTLPMEPDNEELKTLARFIATIDAQAKTIAGLLHKPQADTAHHAIGGIGVGLPSSPLVGQLDRWPDEWLAAVKGAVIISSSLERINISDGEASQIVNRLCEVGAIAGLRDGVVSEIAAERQRQVATEGWSASHDDEHSDGSLAQVAACYALPEKLREIKHGGWTGAARYDDSVWIEPTWKLWPVSWSFEWWKPKDRRRDLIRAAALIVAEIERLDRIPTPRAVAGMIAGPVVTSVAVPDPSFQHPHVDSEDAKAKCRKCQSNRVVTWESGDNPDYGFACTDCDHTWYVDGPDA